MTSSEKLQERDVYYDPRGSYHTKRKSKIMSRLHSFVSVLEGSQEVLCAGT